MLTISLGIDVAKDKLDVALYQADKYKLACFSNDKDGWRRLTRWLKKQKAKGVHVCLEATGRYGEGVAWYLHQHGYPVSVVNPAASRLMPKANCSATRQTGKMPR
ncbi:MAG: transposase [Ardenticatenaceae bacterium]|nr:transposase [Ardenticatenaceae bacterium]